LRSISSILKQWKLPGLIFGLSLLVAVALLLMENLPIDVVSQPGTIHQQSSSLVEEAQWGMWYKGNITQSFPTTLHPYTMGQTITVPGYVSIRVDGITRHWTARSWHISPYLIFKKDDATGKEVILVHFTLTNLKHIPIGYSDRYFSLVRANGREQRVARLAELTASRYGCFGHMSPWLSPGATVHTFVPFLVNPGERPLQFVLSWQTLDAPYARIARIPIVLSTFPSSVVHRLDRHLVKFVPDAIFTVDNADVYSKN